jgi:hypothetical protein
MIMKIHQVAPIATFMFCTIANVQTATAELPSLTTKEALGRFAISENNKYSFNIECKGRFELLPDGGRQKKVHKTSAIVIEPIIEEALPNGSFKARAVNYDSFESNDPATAELEKTTIRGQANGGISFEITTEIHQGTIFHSGKVTNPGPTIKNPLRFALRIKIPSLYQKLAIKSPKLVEEFNETLEDDKVLIKWTDGEKVKSNFSKNVDASSDEINGPGISSVEIDSAAYGGKKVIITAAPNSSLIMSNADSEPLHKGFNLMWTTDPAKDKDHKAQIAIEVR